MDLVGRKVRLFPTEQANTGFSRRIIMMIFLLDSAKRVLVGEPTNISPTIEREAGSGRNLCGLFKDAGRTQEGAGRCAKFLRIIKCLYCLYL